MSVPPADDDVFREQLRELLSREGYDFDEVVERIQAWDVAEKPAPFWQHHLSRQVSFEFRLWGRSALIRDVRQRLLTVAAETENVLLLGESGTGRKQAARVVHNKPPSQFAALDCGALGARDQADFAEILQRSRGGTCYLAQVEGLNPILQRELFEALAVDAAADVRIIAGADPAIERAAVDGRFRADLFEKLSARRIRIPPLRERREDILVLLEGLIDRLGFENVVFAVQRAALEHMLGYSWPGNAAEFATTLATCLGSAEGFEITVRDLPEAILMAPPLTPEDLRPKKIGSYRIEARLGGGGMGEVFRGFDEQLQRNVAIKQVVNADDEEQRELLRQEARIAAQLKHPAIVQIYHLLTEEGNDYVVMEHLEGRTLAQHLAAAGGALDLATALALGCDVAAGLAAAHDQGIVHRDLKTANVILPPERRSAPRGAAPVRAKILDFGLATPYEGAAAAVGAPGDLAGTRHAFSPEHVLGHEVDPRSDLFSLGTLLYEMVTGERPFKGETPTQMLMAICYEPHRSVLEIRPDVPKVLASLIDRLLEKDPDNRPNSAIEVRVILEEIRLAWLMPTAEDAAPVSLPATPAPVQDVDEDKTSARQRLLKGFRRYLRS